MTDTNEIAKMKAALASPTDTPEGLNTVAETLMTLGKNEHLPAIEAQVVAFLTHKEPELRGCAILTLAMHWRIQSYCNTAHEMMVHDPDQEVRLQGLISWAAYFESTGNKEVLRELAHILRDEKNDPALRGMAYFELFAVSSLARNSWPEDARKATAGFAPGLIDWQIVEALTK